MSNAKGQSMNWDAAMVSLVNKIRGRVENSAWAKDKASEFQGYKNYPRTLVPLVAQLGLFLLLNYADSALTMSTLTWYDGQELNPLLSVPAGFISQLAANQQYAILPEGEYHDYIRWGKILLVGLIPWAIILLGRRLDAVKILRLVNIGLFIVVLFNAGFLWLARGG